MIFADTGWFVALVNSSDALHARALLWLADIREPLVTSDYVLLETFNSLSGAAVRQRCHQLVERVLEQSKVLVVRCEAGSFDAGLRLHRDRTDKTWSLVDCISFHLMREMRINRALAHDHHFVQAGFEAMLLRDP